MTRYSFVPAQTGLSGCLSGTLSQCRSQLGAALLDYGIWLIYHPAAFIAGGALLVCAVLFVAWKEQA
jgi:hypothetical protein